jgi:hypothetical protein
MEVQTMTINELRKAGIDALVDALGPLGMARFLQQFDHGKGDYSKEREQWLGNLKVADVLAEIKQRGEIRQLNAPPGKLS